MMLLTSRLRFDPRSRTIHQFYGVVPGKLESAMFVLSTLVREGTKEYFKWATLPLCPTMVITTVYAPQKDLTR